MNRYKLKIFRFIIIIVSLLLVGLLLSCNMRTQDKMDSKETSNNDLIMIEFDYTIGTFKINEEYHFRLNTQIDKKSILLNSNNGINNT